MAKEQKRWRRWWQLAVDVVGNWNRHNASLQSAALAFYTVFSLAPVLVVVIAVAGAVFGADAVRGQIFREFQGLMGAQAAQLVQQVLQSAAKPASGRLATLLGLVTLLLGATAVFVQLQDALNTVWGVAPKPGANFTTLLRKRILSFAIVLGIGFLLMVSLVLSAGLSAFSRYVEAHLGLSVSLLETANLVVSLLAVALLFALIYRLLPDVKLEWRDVWLGAAVTALLFVIGKTAIGLYLGHTSVASAYGAAGSLVIVLLWVYYSSLVFLLGAEFTRIHSRQFRTAHAPPEEGAMRVPPEQAGAVAPPSAAARRSS
jgi:membrane protein